ncbi:unnamed protein product, partial [Hymenolepis diminuta]
HHDNARPHTSGVTKNLVGKFDWEVKHHPPYSHHILPELTGACSSLQIHSMGRRLTSQEEVEMKKLASSFHSNLAKFYNEGMRKLVARWKDENIKNCDYVEH